MRLRLRRPFGGKPMGIGALAAAAAWLGCALSAHAQSGPAQPVPLAVSVPVAAALGPGESRSYALDLAEGSSARLSIEQTAGAVAVEWHSPESSAAFAVRTNPAGLHSSIRGTLLAAAGGETVGVRNLSRTKAAAVRIVVDGVHPGSPEDRARAAAEAAFAAAEAIRTQRSTADYAKALAAYDRATAGWRSLGDSADAARALAWKALFLFVNRNDPAAALPVSQDSLAQAAKAPGIDPAELANCHKIAGYVQVQLAHYEAGRAEYQAASALFEQTHDLFNREVLLDNLSRVERLQGNTDAALATAREAESLAAQMGDAVRQLTIQAEIGAIELSASHLQAAYTAYQGALALLQHNPDPTTEGYVWSDLGVLYTTLHEPEQARNALDRALEIWKQHPNPTGELNTLDDYGELWLSQSKTALALGYYQRGLTLARKESLERPEVFLLRGLGAAYLLANDLPQAEQNLDEALALALKIEEGDGLPEIYCLRGDLAVRKRDAAGAEAAYGRCGDSARSAKDVYSAIRADGSLARLRFNQGRDGEAEEFAERALAGIEATRTSMPEQDLRTSFFASMRSYYELSVDILERLDALHPGEGYQWSAFLTAERARARMLLDRIAPGEESAGGGSALSAEYAEVEATLRRSQQALDALPAHGMAARRQRLKDEIARLTVEDHALASGLKPASSSGNAAPPLTLASLQASLNGNHAALLEYWTGERASYLWVTTSRDFRVFRLAAAARLGGAAASFTQRVLEPGTQNPTRTAEDRVRTQPEQERALSRDARSLRALLFPRGAIAPTMDTLLIAPDGPLDAISFAALLRVPASVAASVPPGVAAAVEAGCGRCAIVREPSATFLLALLSRPAAQHRQERVAIFAENPGPRSTPELPFVADEVSAVRHAAGASHVSVMFGAEASPSAIRSFSWDGFTIGHFAAHATLNPANLQLSGLQLEAAPGAGGDDASTLWYGDICRLHLRLDLVVLSACQTAAGAEIPGEGLVGLTQAFFSAGAQRVLGSLWAVDDEATATLMRYFYTALQASGSPAAALQQAQARMAATERWHLPYYWAGFSLAGDWRALP